MKKQLKCLQGLVRQTDEPNLIIIYCTVPSAKDAARTSDPKRHIVRLPTLRRLPFRKSQSDQLEIWMPGRNYGRRQYSRISYGKILRVVRVQERFLGDIYRRSKAGNMFSKLCSTAALAVRKVCERWKSNGIKNSG